MKELFASAICQQRQRGGLRSRDDDDGIFKMGDGNE